MSQKPETGDMADFDAEDIKILDAILAERAAKQNLTKKPTDARSERGILQR